MGIQITNAPVKPGVTYDQVFLKRLVIEQEHQSVHAAQPVFNVIIKYRMFGVDQDGIRHYSGDGIQTIEVNDWITHCIAHHPNDPPVLAAMSAIEGAVAVLIGEDRQTSASVI